MKTLIKLSTVFMVAMLLFSWQPVVAEEPPCISNDPTFPVGIVPEQTPSGRLGNPPL